MIVWLDFPPRGLYGRIYTTPLASHTSGGNAICLVAFGSVSEEILRRVMATRVARSLTVADLSPCVFAIWVKITETAVRLIR